MDNRIRELAKKLVQYSCRVQTGERVMIELTGPEGIPLVNCLVKEVYAAGGLPFVEMHSQETLREILHGATDAQLGIMAKKGADMMRQMDAYIGITAMENAAELSDVPAERMAQYNLLYRKPVHSDIRVPKTKWVVLRYPTRAMAQSSKQSMEAFEDFFFDVCCMDYEKMSLAMDALVERMNRTDRVRITGRGTDLSFSIQNIPAVKCDGQMNIPDGEVYTAPVRESVNGVITYNTPSEHQGFTYEDVCLTFKDGKIVAAEANDTARLTEVFDTDEGARYVGEFAIGVHPRILRPMQNILFDEKIMGSIHFTPGCCYEDADNGNTSAIHWDLVCIQTPEYGGGEIWFDEELVRKDGRFVTPDLVCLNPENLV